MRAVLWLLLAAPLVAQEPRSISRAEAVRAALEQGPRLRAARADTAIAYAALRTARAFSNPAVSATYSKSVPQYHLIAELPLDFLLLRGARVGSAEAGRSAAQFRFAFDQAAITLEVDTLYTRAQAALARLKLSRHNAEAADSLRLMAARRRDAGDASDLDVDLASVNAGQQANAAAADSLALTASLLDLSTVIGGAPAVPGDSLVAPADSAPDESSGTPLPVAAAEATVTAADLAVSLQKRSALPMPAVTFGFEQGDPTGAEPGVLPTFGVSIPLPLFNFNGGPIAQAEAERDRARAELDIARLETAARIAEARRSRAIALARSARDARLVESANRVAAMSLRAYREGAVSLPSVLEAQRNARDILSQYVDDLATAWNTTAALKVLTMTAPGAR